jgi:diguanylate cyclase (GGDEF)-like protein
MSLVMMDVDFFKRYNDLYGHPAGDRVLISVADALNSELLRPADMIARYGGEEFVAILPDSGPEGSLIVAERLRAAIFDLNIFHGGSEIADRVTMSIGVASYLPGTTCNETSLLEAADMALYNAKHGGRNCVRHVPI